MKIGKKFPGVFTFAGKLLTKNLTPGRSVYGEELLSFEGEEYRIWNPHRSKLAAAIMNGLKKMPLAEGSRVLYLGAAEGTTISHISDIAGQRGMVVGVDMSAKTMQKFTYLCEQRGNIVPILADADNPESYRNDLQGFKANLLHQDVSQRNQADIFLKNARMYLRKGGYGMLVVKARSISAVGRPEQIFQQEEKRLKGVFDIVQRISLEPFDREHAMIVCRKRI